MRVMIQLSQGASQLRDHRQLLHLGQEVEPEGRLKDREVHAEVGDQGDAGGAVAAGLENGLDKEKDLSLVPTLKRRLNKEVA